MSKTTTFEKYSMTRKVFGTVTAVTLVTGIFGLAGLIITGVKSDAIYWSMVWIFLAFTATGVIGTRIYTMIWSKRK